MRIDGPQITGSFSLNGDGVQDLDVFATTSSLNTYTSSTDTMMGHVLTATHSLNTFTGSASSRMVSIEGKTGSYATTGSNTFVGLQTIQGSIVPSAHATYDLGSAGYNFRHLYLSSASLYIDGTKVLGSTTQELQITTDNGQSFKILEAGSDTITLQSNDGNITLATSGGGDVILDPTTGIIALKGTTQVYSGNKVRSSDGNNIVFGDGLTVSGSITVTGFIETQELRTTYISSSILYRSGSTKFGDELDDTHSFTGSLLVSGSISVPGSGLISGSSQILNGSGVWSGSVQLPSGVVSGSAQVDVMSTTNIARLATTGSNTFNGNQIVSGSLTSTGNLRAGGISIGVAPTSNVLDVRGENNTYDGTIILGARGTIQHRDAGQTILSIANDYNSNTAKFEIRMKGNTTSDAKLTILGSGDATFSNTLQANAKLYLQRASTGADTLIQFKNEVGVDKAYIKFGGTDEELAFYAGAGGTRNLIIGPSGEMAFNTSTVGVRSYLFKALSGRQLVIEALESSGVHSIYLRPSSSGRNLITSNYFSGGVYLPLALSGRENDTDLVLSNGNVGINTDSPTQKLHVAGYIRTNGVSVFKTGGSISGFIGHEQDWLGSGTSNNLICASEGGNDFKVFTNGTTAERITATSTGYVYLGKGWGASNHRINLEVAQGNNILVVSAYAGASNDSVLIKAASGANPNAAGTVMQVTTNSSTGRSISAGGTINASGNDYAEYMLKATTDTINKGDIVGVNIDGKLTNIFNESISFVVKSTDPSYVGGDNWFNDEKRPSRTTDQTEEEFAPILADFESRLEIERAKVDRIAFSGQVPVNVTGATVGNYIIPIETEDGKITGQAIINPSFDQYKISVGKVWKIMEDGRAFIAIKIG